MVQFYYYLLTKIDITRNNVISQRAEYKDSIQGIDELSLYSTHTILSDNEQILNIWRNIRVRLWVGARIWLGVKLNKNVKVGIRLRVRVRVQVRVQARVKVQAWIKLRLGVTLKRRI